MKITGGKVVNINFILCSLFSLSHSFAIQESKFTLPFPLFGVSVHKKNETHKTKMMMMIFDASLIDLKTIYVNSRSCLATVFVIRFIGDLFSFIVSSFQPLYQR